MAEVLPRDVRVLRDQAARRVRDVRDVQFAQISQCRTPAELAETEQELHATLAKIGALVRQVADEAPDGSSPAECAAIEAAAREDRKTLDTLRVEARKCLLGAQRTVQAAAENAARDALQLGSQNAKERTKKASGDRAEAASEEVTSALQRTVALMSTELEKSGFSAQLLEESSEGLAQISEAYQSFGSLLRNSVDLIKQMERQELWDLGVLVASLSFFVGCIAYILYVRIISKGLSVLGLAWRVTGIVKHIPGVSHSAASLAATASVATAMRRSPAEAPRKRVHRDDPIADATRGMPDTPLPSPSTWTRPRGAMRGVDARRNAEAFRDAEAQAEAEARQLREAQEEEARRQREAQEDEARRAAIAQREQAELEARFAELESDALRDLPVRTATTAASPLAKKPRRKMGTMDVPQSTAQSIKRATPAPDEPSRVLAGEAESHTDAAPEAAPEPAPAPVPDAPKESVVEPVPEPMPEAISRVGSVVPVTGSGGAQQTASPEEREVRSSASPAVPSTDSAVRTASVSTEGEATSSAELPAEPSASSDAVPAPSAAADVGDHVSSTKGEPMPSASVFSKEERASDPASVASSSSDEAEAVSRDVSHDEAASSDASHDEAASSDASHDVAHASSATHAPPSSSVLATSTASVAPSSSDVSSTSHVPSTTLLDDASTSSAPATSPLTTPSPRDAHVSKAAAALSLASASLESAAATLAPEVYSAASAKLYSASVSLDQVLAPTTTAEPLLSKAASAVQALGHAPSAVGDVLGKASSVVSDAFVPTPTSLHDEL